MAERPIGVTDLASGAGVAQFRTREHTVGGQLVCEQYVLPLVDWVPSFTGMVSTFRQPGVAVAGQPHFSLFNKTGSGVLVAVRELTSQHDRTTNSGTMRSWTASRITTAPTTGTLLTPVALDGTHDVDVECRGLASADGTNGTLTATPGTGGWRLVNGVRNAVATQTDQHYYIDREFLPFVTRSTPLVLREGEGILVVQSQAGATSEHNLIRVAFDEFTL